MGLAVGKLRTHDDRRISDIAKTIVKKWKSDVSKKPKSNSTSQQPTPTSTTNNDNNDSEEKPSINIKNDTPRSGKSDGVDFEKLDDKVRNTCLSLIYNAMVFDSSAPSELIMERALSIEKIVYEDNRCTTGEEYKKKIRSLMLNLKDKKNPALREAVISGDTTTSTFCRMSSSVSLSILKL